MVYTGPLILGFIIGFILGIRIIPSPESKLKFGASVHGTPTQFLQMV
jgi:energy-converting hydrogenase B subunit J